MSPIHADLIQAIENIPENCGMMFQNDSIPALKAIVLDLAYWSRDVQSAYDKLAHKVDVLAKVVDSLVSKSEKSTDLAAKLASLTKKVEDLAKTTNTHSQK